MQPPKLENPARTSLLADAMTDSAVSTLDGEELQAFALLLPAATA